MSHNGSARNLIEFTQSKKIAMTLGSSNNLIYQKILEIIKRKNLQGSVLDFGSGAGNLTRLLVGLNKFSNVKACDLFGIPNDLKGKVEWLERDLNSFVNTDPVDLVVAAEVVEHLENPRMMVKNISNILKPGGTIILSTPNNLSLRSLISLALKGHFVDFLDSSYPAHISALLQKDLERILKENGFVNLEFNYLKRGTLPFFTKYSWQGISFGILRGSFFSDTIFVTAQKPL